MYLSLQAEQDLTLKGVVVLVWTFYISIIKVFLWCLWKNDLIKPNENGGYEIY